MRSVPPVVSVIVPARNEERYIAAQLEALAGQSFAEPWELMVVDHGSTDRTPDIVRGWQSRLPNLRLESAPDAVTVGGLRNRGVALARADLFAFCDADDVVDPDWLAGMVRGLRAHDVVAGQRAFERLNPPGTYPYSSAVNRAPRCGPYVVVSGCNFGATRAAYDAAGGMTDDVPWGEDTDFGLRVNELGLDLAYLDDAVVHRRLPHTFRGVFRKQFGYGTSQVKVVRRHPALLGGRPWIANMLREYVFLVVRAYWLLDRSKRLHWAMVAGRRAGRLRETLRRS